MRLSDSVHSLSMQSCAESMCLPGAPVQREPLQIAMAALPQGHPPKRRTAERHLAPPAQDLHIALAGRDGAREDGVGRFRQGRPELLREVEEPRAVSAGPRRPRDQPRHRAIGSHTPCGSFRPQSRKRDPKEERKRFRCGGGVSREASWPS